MLFLKIPEFEKYENVNKIYASIRSPRSRCLSCGKYSNRIKGINNLKDGVLHVFLELIRLFELLYQFSIF